MGRDRGRQRSKDGSEPAAAVPSRRRERRRDGPQLHTCIHCNLGENGTRRAALGRQSACRETTDRESGAASREHLLDIGNQLTMRCRERASPQIPHDPPGGVNSRKTGAHGFPQPSPHTVSQDRLPKRAGRCEADLGAVLCRDSTRLAQTKRDETACRHLKALFVDGSEIRRPQQPAGFGKGTSAARHGKSRRAASPTWRNEQRAHR